MKTSTRQLLPDAVRTWEPRRQAWLTTHSTAPEDPTSVQRPTLHSGAAGCWLRLRLSSPGEEPGTWALSSPLSCQWLTQQPWPADRICGGEGGGAGVRSRQRHWTKGQNQDRGSHQVLVEGDMLLWRPNGKDSGRCGRPEVPECQGWAPSTDLGRKEAGSVIMSCGFPVSTASHTLPRSPSNLSQ